MSINNVDARKLKDHVIEHFDTCVRYKEDRRSIRCTKRMYQLLQTFTTDLKNEYNSAFGQNMAFGGIVDYMHHGNHWEPTEERYYLLTDMNRIKELDEYERYKLAGQAPKNVVVEMEPKTKYLHFYANDEVMVHYEMLAYICGLDSSADIIRILILKTFYDTDYFWPYKYESEYHWRELFEIIEPYFKKQMSQKVTPVYEEKAEEESMED